MAARAVGGPLPPHRCHGDTSPNFKLKDAIFAPGAVGAASRRYEVDTKLPDYFD